MQGFLQTDTCSASRAFGARERVPRQRNSSITCSAEWKIQNAHLPVRRSKKVPSPADYATWTAKCSRTPYSSVPESKWIMNNPHTIYIRISPACPGGREMRAGQSDFLGHILAERAGAPGERKEHESLAASGKSYHIRVQLSAALCRYAGCPSELALSAATVGSALRQLEPSHPRLYRSICQESGALRPHVNLFLNSDRIDELNGMDSRLQPGDILTVLPAVSGGSPCRNG